MVQCLIIGFMHRQLSVTPDRYSARHIQTLHPFKTHGTRQPCSRALHPSPSQRSCSVGTSDRPRWLLYRVSSGGPSSATHSTANRDQTTWIWVRRHTRRYTWKLVRTNV